MRWIREMAGAVAGLALTVGTAGAGEIAGRTAEERAVNGAKAYLNKAGLKSLKLNVLGSPFFTKPMEEEIPIFEKLTGIGVGAITEVAVLDVPTKVTAEMVAKTGKFDLFVDGVLSIPEAAEGKMMLPLDDFVKVGKPDVEGNIQVLEGQTWYKGRKYGLLNDGDQFTMVLRKDWLDKPEESAKFKAKYGWGPGCPETFEQWEQLAEFYTRDLDGDGRPDFFGAIGYRARGWGFRWWLMQYYATGKLPFDDQMRPTINSPEGIRATKDYVSIIKYMPKDILGWATPQAYPFFAGGHAFSIMTYGSIVLTARHPEKSKVRDSLQHCVVPGYRVGNRLIRRAIQGYGNAFYINAHGKHHEASYWLMQWLSSKEVMARLIAGRKGVYDPFAEAHFTDPRIVEGYSKEFLEVHVKNARIAVPMVLLEGGREYHDVLDSNLMSAVTGKMTPEEMVKRTAAEWEKITDRIGRKRQIEAWMALKKSMPTVDVP